MNIVCKRIGLLGFMISKVRVLISENQNRSKCENDLKIIWIIRVAISII